MIKYAWLANEVTATDNTPLCANLCKFLTDTLIKSRQSLTEIRACKHVIVCIVHTEATRTYKECGCSAPSINRNNKLIQTGDLRSTGEFVAWQALFCVLDQLRRLRWFFAESLQTPVSCAVYF